MLAVMSNTKSQRERCADAMLADDRMLLLIVEDDGSIPGELIALQLRARTHPRRARTIEQIWSIGLDQVPTERFQRHRRQIHRREGDDAAR